MKLRYLTVLISSMVVSGTSGATEVYNKNGNKLDLYGTLNSMHYLSSNDNESGDRSSIDYSVHGETQINDQLVGFGTWENEIIARHSENQVSKNNIRLGFVGLKLREGHSFDYGRNYGVLYDVGVLTNVMPEFSGNTTMLSDNFLSGPGDSVLTYRNINFFGIVDNLNIALQCQRENNHKDSGGSNAQKGNGEGYGLSVSYNFGNGISAASAYSHSKLSQSQRRLVTDIHYRGSTGNIAEAYTFGIKYDAHALYLAALYSETYHMTPFGKFSDQADHEIFGFAENAKNIELVAQYKLDFGLRPSIGYIQSRIDTDKNGVMYNFKKYVEIGSSYTFNKNMSTFVDYKINLLNKDDFSRAASISTENILAIGISYIF